MKYGYRLTPVGRRKASEGLITKIGKNVVNLAGVDITHTYPPTRNSPEITVTFEAATDKHLKAYYDRGFQTLVERFEIIEQKPKGKEKEKKEGNESK